MGRCNLCGFSSAWLTLYLAGRVNMKGEIYDCIITNSSDHSTESYKSTTCTHYGDVIMSAMASEITVVSMVCSTVCYDADQRNINDPHHWRGKKFQLMTSPWTAVGISLVLKGILEDWRLHTCCLTRPTFDCQHTEAETKWPPFFRRHFQMHFLEWKCINFD